jgi:curli biogenesis system outer membrane secretion channel CsgG
MMEHTDFRIAVLMIILAVCLPAVAKEESVAELVQRAQSASQDDQPNLYIKIAELQLKAADKLFAAGNSPAAQAAVQDVATYSRKATDAAIETGKKLKKTEISLRKMADRLQDIKREVNYEDQAPVQSAVDKLEDMRTRLLNRMFGKKSK